MDTKVSYQISFINYKNLSILSLPDTLNMDKFNLSILAIFRTGKCQFILEADKMELDGISKINKIYNGYQAILTPFGSVIRVSYIVPYNLNDALMVSQFMNISDNSDLNVLQCLNRHNYIDYIFKENTNGRISECFIKNPNNFDKILLLSALMETCVNHNSKLKQIDFLKALKLLSKEVEPSTILQNMKEFIKDY